MTNMNSGTSPLDLQRIREWRKPQRREAARRQRQADAWMYKHRLREAYANDRELARYQAEQRSWASLTAREDETTNPHLPGWWSRRTTTGISETTD